MRLTAVVAALTLGLAIAANAAEPAAPAAPAAKPAAPAMPMPKAGPITAPKGDYKVDPNHASVTWKVLHFGLSKYTARFNKFDVNLSLDPAKVASSSVTATIDVNSVETDFPGDFKASHKDSPYATFDERVAREFLKADTSPTITFKSTKVEAKGKDKLKVTGDLTLNGQTHPVTMDAIVIGSIAKHPFTGRGAVGFSATTTFKRSEWGVSGGVPMIGDEVTVTFEGEFQQAAPDEPAPKPAN
jgi:polyisoprenoid-binding protein YceI